MDPQPGQAASSPFAHRRAQRRIDRAWIVLGVGLVLWCAAAGLGVAAGTRTPSDGGAVWLFAASLTLVAGAAVVAAHAALRKPDSIGLIIDGAVVLAATGWTMTTTVGASGPASIGADVLAAVSALTVAVSLTYLVRANSVPLRLMLTSAIVLAVTAGTALHHLGGLEVPLTIAGSLGAVFLAAFARGTARQMRARADAVASFWLRFLPIVPCLVAVAIAVTRPGLVTPAQRWALVGVVAIALVRQSWEAGRSHGDLRRLQQTLGALHHAALHDPLTKLANRAHFHAQVERATRRHRGQAIGVLFIDVDDFKTINDTLGHAAGDDLLVQVGERIRSASRGTDTVARLGGDEFGVLLDGLAHPGDAEELARRVLESMARPFVLERGELRVATSIGVATGTDGRTNVSQLLGQADMALYAAKRRGKNQFLRFSPTMQRDAVERFDLQAELRAAVDEERIEPHFQPIVELGSNRIVGFEALARWNHSTRGMVRPDRFIPLAEELGIVHALGISVLEAACRQLAWWNDAWPETRPLHIAVNISARQFDKKTLLEDILRVLQDTGIPPTQLVVEVTESSVMENPQSVLRTLQRLREIGIRVAIDDFGTGYSALQYLRQFPVDVLKIDKSFVMNAHGDRTSATLLQAMVELAHSLDLETVAEGVETHGQLDTLSRLGCDMVQGHLLATPGDPKHTIALLRALESQDWQLIPGPDEETRRRAIARRVAAGMH